MTTAIAFRKLSVFRSLPQKKSVLLPLLLVSILVGLVFYHIPIRQNLELDLDEGINLIKSSLSVQGFSLYREIWSDQPPFFTLLLAQWFKILGQSLFSARLLILTFSSLLVCFFYYLLRDKLGERGAFLGSIFLITSWHYLKLSGSVMIGLPAIALALGAIYFSERYKQSDRKFDLLLSALFFALSLHTKLFTVFLIPLVWVNTFVLTPRFQKVRLFRSFLYWLLPLSLAYLILGISFHSINIDQLLGAHFHPSVRTDTSNPPNIQSLLKMLSYDWEYLCLASFGVISLWQQKKTTHLFPLYWLIVACLILFVQKPIRYHYYLLISIPMCWLAAYGIEWAIATVKTSRKKYQKLQFLPRKVLHSSVLLFLVISLSSTAWIELSRPIKIFGYKSEIRSLLLDYRNQTNWVFTDRPIYAFNANLIVPPEIAVMSTKRFAGENMQTTEMIKVTQKYRPEQIILARQNQLAQPDSPFHDSLKNNYTKVYEYICSQPKPTCTPISHYILTEILKPETPIISKSGS